VAVLDVIVVVRSTARCNTRCCRGQCWAPAWSGAPFSPCCRLPWTGSSPRRTMIDGTPFLVGARRRNAAPGGSLR